MSKKIELGERPLFNKIRAMSNEYRFRILELAEAEKMCITELSSTLKLSYTKCADYIRLLEKEGLVRKKRNGKEVFVESRVRIKGDRIDFV